MSLTTKDAAIILGMVKRGDKKHDVASWFGENPARVQEVIAGEYGTLVPASADQLPPKGAPGPKGRRLKAAAVKSLAELESGNVNGAIGRLKEAIAQFEKHEA
ncbi:MAG: hypothetical protein KKH72_10665 [Alphaproteobacteria bacterium]|nr:hypothetical protein [Alphaproteobacteria bacterium]